MKNKPLNVEIKPQKKLRIYLIQQFFKLTPT